METILIMLYALLTINTAELNTAIETNAPQEEVQQLQEGNDCLRREIQVIRR